MKRLTVVPADSLIIIDGEALRFDFPAPSNLHALQWDNVTQSGHLEFTDDYNQALDGSLYDEEVAPFVALWEAEKPASPPRPKPQKPPGWKSTTASPPATSACVPSAIGV